MTAGTKAGTDPAAMLAEIGERGKAGTATRDDTLRLLVFAAGLVAEHEFVQLYESAEGCDHARPPCTDGCPEDECYGCPGVDAWLVEHPYGSTGERICMSTPIDRACVKCTDTAFGEEPNGDDYIEADRCHILKALEIAMTAEPAS